MQQVLRCLMDRMNLPNMALVLTCDLDRRNQRDISLLEMCLVDKSNHLDKLEAQLNLLHRTCSLGMEVRWSFLLDNRSPLDTTDNLSMHCLPSMPQTCLLDSL